MTWCTKNLPEFYKCGNFTQNIERDKGLFDDDFLEVKCLRAYNADECIHHIDREEAHITTLDAGDIFTAGRFNSLIPIMREHFDGGFAYYYAVAVVKAGTMSDVFSLRDLRMKKACFPWVGSLAGWIIPIYTLQKEGGMEIVDCNNHVKTATAFFNSSCAVNSLIDKYNPIGDNSDRLCALCTGVVPGGKCTPSDPYYGYDGAFRCLLEAGDVAFLKHSTVLEMVQGDEFKSISAERFELLCKDGTKRPLSEYRSCNWGKVPSDAIVTSSGRHYEERKKYQKFFERAVELYSHKPRNHNSTGQNRFGDQNYNNFGGGLDNNYNNNNRFNNEYDPNRNLYNTNNDPNYYNQDQYNQNNPYNDNRFGRLDNSFTTSTGNPLEGDVNGTLYEKFELFESNRYGKLNALFQDSARYLTPIEIDDQSHTTYLEHALDFIYGIRQCPVGKMALCITSDPEMEKCIKMRTALKAQIIKPDLSCYKAHSHINCMQAIASGQADVAVFDAGDVYTGGLKHDLIPIMSEIYNLGEPEYYVVAVGKEEDPDTELTYLKGKYTCHTGINTAAGWTYPMAYLISNGWIRPYGCDSVRAAAEYFTKSCVPGAISSEYNTGVPYDTMCDLCHGQSSKYCRRDASEDYYGHTGAFRCLVEGGGHVAFVKHTTVSENTGGKRKEFWARNTLNDDFELLCPDGTRAELYEYHRCNLGKVKANAIVTRGGEAYNETQINAYINLFSYAQQLYGRKEVDAFSFSMFYSPPPYYDLIFQDATRQLQVIKPEKRRYDLYLGSNFMRARRITDCHAGANSLNVSKNILISISIILISYVIVF